MSISSVLLSNRLNSKAPARTEAHPSIHCRPALSPRQLPLGQIPGSAKSPAPREPARRLRGWIVEWLRERRYQEKMVDTSLVGRLVEQAIADPTRLHVMISGDLD